MNLTQAEQSRIVGPLSLQPNSFQRADLLNLRDALADRYRIEHELGRGGFATVFLAHDRQHDRPVALKVLHPEIAATLGSDRFRREIRLAARLLQTPPHLASGEHTNFALGWKIEQLQVAGAPTRMVAHRATPNGSTVALLVFPEYGIAVAAAANISPADGVDPAGRRIAEVFAQRSGS